MIPDNVFLMMGVAAVFIVIGIILAIRWREQQRRRKFWVDPPFET
jgi:hypothetical protein